MTADAQLEPFIAKFAPDIAAQARAMVAAMRGRLPWATVLVYDNYNALAIGFGTGDRVADMILSLAVYPRWVMLYFASGRQLADPDGLLRGTGNKGRHIRLAGPDDLGRPAIAALIDAATAPAPPADRTAAGRLIIKSVSARQRPRRPGADQ